jgi:16S rRNA (cytosine967-C5)-methyltransferase
LLISFYPYFCKNCRKNSQIANKNYGTYSQKPPHRNSRSLQETFFEKNKYADKVIERLLKAHRKWGSQDRAVVSEIFYNIIRWKKRLEYYIGEGAKPGNIYKLILAYLLWSKTHYKKFEEFDGIKIADILTKLKKGTVPNKAFEHSIPDWLAETLEKELGANWEKEMMALNEQAPTILRANSLKTSAKHLIEELKHENVESFTINGFKDAVQLEEKKNVFLTSAFKDGLFEVQDAGSQKIAEFLDVKPNASGRCLRRSWRKNTSPCCYDGK